MRNNLLTVFSIIVMLLSAYTTFTQNTVDREIGELYFSRTSIQQEGGHTQTLQFNRVMGTTSAYEKGLFEIATTLTSTDTLRFIARNADQSSWAYGRGSTAGSLLQDGPGICPGVTGEVLIRVNLNTGSFQIYPINPLRISQMGSSVSGGAHAENNWGYAYLHHQLLSQRFTNGKGADWEVSNISIGGNTTIHLLDRWDSDLLSNNSKFVVYALSLANEGIIGGGQARFDQFKENMQLLISKARSAGKIPIIANCYAHNGYSSVEYEFIQQMNLLIHEWDVPSYNLLGAIDDGQGRWVEGYFSDDGHPNTKGHRAFFHSIVPSLFDALLAGKPQPVMQNGKSWLSAGTSITSDIFRIIPEDTVQSFTNSIDVRTTSTGEILHIETGGDQQQVVHIDANGRFRYTSSDGDVVYSNTAINDGAWHKITLTHYHPLRKTNLYINNTLVGTVNESSTPAAITINPVSAPELIDYRNWMFYRSAMNHSEIEALHSGSLLKSSLEIYAPLDQQRNLSPDPLANHAQSMNDIQRLSKK